MKLIEKLRRRRPEPAPHRGLLPPGQGRAPALGLLPPSGPCPRGRVGVMGDVRNRASMTECAHCGSRVWTERLLEHWQAFCPDTPRPIGDQNDPYEALWNQVDEIVAAQGFDRYRDPREGWWR